MPEGGYEVLVIDDASRDGTEQILNNFADDIRCVRLEQNKGLSHARNLGVKMAKGQRLLVFGANDHGPEPIVGRRFMRLLYRG